MGIDLRARCLGGLIGCAAGDALGAPFEGLWSHSIPDEETLLAGFAEFEGYPRGQYTDDTQLTVATLEAVVREGSVSPAAIAASIARLWKRGEVVGPGGACMQAAMTYLKTRDWTTCGAEVGQAGNGTAMRTAVLGLFFLDEPGRLPGVVADVSRITHKDPRSIAGGVAVAKTAQLLAGGSDDSPVAVCREVAAAMAPYEASFAALVADLPARLSLDPGEALRQIAWSGVDRPGLDTPIITPFVIPTVLASLWCVLKHPSSWPRAVVSALRMGGDVDTLGAIVGALAGVRLGADAIPVHLRQTVLHSQRLESLALRYHALIAARAGSG